MSTLAYSELSEEGKLMNYSKSREAEDGRGPLPPALQIAEEVTDCHIEGGYDLSTETWSDREFASAGPKKHNEAM